MSHSDSGAFSEHICFTVYNSTRMKDELMLNQNKEFKNGNGEWMKGVYSEILSGGCLVQMVTQTTLKSVMAPVRNLLPEVILLALFTSLLLVVLSWLVTRKLTRTLSALTSAVSDIVKGNYDVKLDPQQNDEIGNLSNAFVEMADHIRKTTLELREREERLAHFYDATIDGIVLHDNGKPLLVNQALCRLTGFSEEELMQKDVYKHLIRPSNLRVPAACATLQLRN
jgi:signal transduction histidine kinase